MEKTIITPWTIQRYGAIDDFCQSIFFIGNGEIGTRGFSTQELKAAPQEHGVFKAGLYDYIKPGITDMVQLPDVLTLRAEGETPQNTCQQLDMQRAILIHRWESERVYVETRRMVSMAQKGLICVKSTLTAKKAGTYVIAGIADPWVENLPVHDDQMLEQLETIPLLDVKELTVNGLKMATRYSKEPIGFTWIYHFLEECQQESAVSNGKAITKFTVVLKQGESFTLEKRVQVSPLVQDIGEHPWEDHQAAWARLWEDADIQLDGADEIQGAVRYNIFQLLCNNAGENPNVSMGARGLTHGRYKGNTFWDTEIFLLPFYTWVRPQAARNLLQYRVDRLQDAKDLALKQNLQGARYPWMCSKTGQEQCESWDIGLCEVHITADIAYAMHRYAKTTGDKAYEQEAFAEVYRQTAIYWASRLNWEESKGQYSSFFVKGPDEYCGAAVNNTYTNYMARHNIDLALDNCYLSPEERKCLTHVREHIAILYDEKRELYLQDELFDRLEPAPFLRQDNTPLYKQVCFDRMQRYKVLKQADLVQLMLLFSRDFTLEQKKNVYSAYEPLTVHDSTLSYGPHAQLAFELGLWEKAEDYFHKALYLDLYDMMGNTGKEGLHMAALGGAWQALVFGIAGVDIGNEKLAVTPRLPPFIHGMRFKIHCQGQRFTIAIHEGGVVHVSS